jgi:septal ring factor EnvC (AmiA/AmiB activator)
MSVETTLQFYCVDSSRQHNHKNPKKKPQKTSKNSQKTYKFHKKKTKKISKNASNTRKNLKVLEKFVKTLPLELLRTNSDGKKLFFLP